MARPGRLIAAPFFALVLALTSCAEADSSAEPASSPTQSSSATAERNDSPTPSEEPESSEESASEEPSGGAASESASSSENPSDEASTDDDADADPGSSDSASSGPAEQPESPEPSPSDAAEDSADTAVVARIIDGDTVELDAGDVVRVTGIDTPERGECHFEEASDRMGQLVLGQTVTLTQDGEDADRYDRLLRYLDVDGVDAGLTLIQEGYAVARYDSRDGYGYHACEDDYIAAEAAAPDLGCAEDAPEPEPEPEPAPEPAPGSEADQGDDCAPGYSPCIPPYPPDLNCSDLDFPVYVTGDDPHDLDRDGDGVGCEGNG